MGIKYRCRQCGNVVKASREDMGKNRRCPHCGAKGIIRSAPPVLPPIDLGRVETRAQAAKVASRQAIGTTFAVVVVVLLLSIMVLGVLHVANMPSAQPHTRIAQHDSTMMISGLVLFAIFAPLFLAFYFVPTIIAFTLASEIRIPIFLANIFFGWTFVGWVLCLVFAVWPNEVREHYHVHQNN